MVASPTNSSSTPGPLSLDLLEPLKNRSIRVLLSDQENQSDPDPRYIAALRRLMAADLQSGAINRDDLTHILAIAVDKMGSVRQAPGSAVAWALPGEPWVEYADSDPRVSLVAWLIHQGANPWAVNQANIVDRDRWMGFASTASLMLTYGYIASATQALCLPDARNQDLAQMCANRWDYSNERLNLVETAAHVGATNALDRLHELGADMGDALWHARDSATVHALIRLRAKTKGTGGPDNIELGQHWSKVLPATSVRSMMAALATSITPSAAVLSAARSNTWAPLKDAIDACPGWQDIKSTLSSGLEVRLPAAMIIRACAGSVEARTAQALRMVTRGLPDDREIAPGFTEKSFVRLALAKTLKKMSHGTRTALKLAEQAQSLLDKLSAPSTSELALLEDGMAFAAAMGATPSLAKQTSITNFVLDYRLATPNEFNHVGGLFVDHQDISAASKLLPTRSVDELLAIAGILHAWIMDPGMPAIGGFVQAFGVETPSGSGSIYQNAVASEGRWLDTMCKNNPSRRDEIVYAGTVFTAYLMTHRGMMNSITSSRGPNVKLDKWSSRVEGWIAQGLDPGVDQSFAAIVAERAADHPSEHARRFTQCLVARLSRLQLNATVSPSAETVVPGIRF